MLLSVCLVTASLTALGDTVYKKPNEIRVRIHRTAQRPVLDGRLDDDAWKGAQPLTRFVQYEPVDSVLPPTESVGWVTYDSRHLYVAFRAYEPDPTKLRGAMHPRERGVGPEDKVTISIDTFNDSRRNYVFRVTSLGLQEDGIKTEGMGSTDNTPDFVWYSAARIDSAGWTIEAAIPFASLRWPRKDTLNIGFDLVRWRGWTGALESWAPRRRGNPCDLCQKGTLLGITGIDTRPTTDILPYVSASRVGARRFGTDSVQVGGAWQQIAPPLDFATNNPTGNIGADVRFALTSSTTLNATINPDFSQIEADNEQVRVNQRFTIFNEERRPFFLEARDVFETIPRDGDAVGGALFYSRSIVNPSSGARLTTRNGRTTFAALYARDDDPGYYYFDGYESSGYLASLGAQADVLVARVRRDVLSDSYFGVSVNGRRMDDAHSAVANADFWIRRKSLVFMGEAAWSDERAPRDSARSTFLDGRRLNGLSYRSRLAYNSRGLAANLTTSGVSPEFRDQLGRFSRVGLKSYAAHAEVTQYPNNRVLQRIQEQVDLSRSDAYDGGLVDWRVSPSVEVQFRRRTSLNLSVSEVLATLYGTRLRTTAASLDFQSQAAQRFALGGSLTVGEREIVDPADPRVGDGISGSLDVSLRPVPQASVELRGERASNYERWGRERVNEAKIVRLRATYQLSRAIGARMIGEYSDQFNALDSEVSQRTQRYTSSVLISWEIAPASFFYVGYNDAQQEFATPIVAQRRVLRTGNLFFLKFSYLVRVVSPQS